MSVVKCCGEPTNCPRNCSWATKIQDTVMPPPVFVGGAPADPPKAVNPKDGIGNTKLPLHL